MALYEMSADLVDAIDRIVDYSYAAEQRDYEENGGEHHIFTDLNAVNKWLVTHQPVKVRPDGPETARGGLIGQGGY